MANTGKKLLLLGKYRPSGTGAPNDIYTVVDGHYIGHDGFVVPRNADEFLERFPNYVSAGSRSGSTDRQPPRTWQTGRKTHFDLKTLPETSKHCLEGKADVIENVRSGEAPWANEARFRNYVNLCLANRFNTLFAKRRRDALGRNNWVPLAGGFGCKEPGTVDDEFLPPRIGIPHSSRATLDRAGNRPPPYCRVDPLR